MEYRSRSVDAGRPRRSRRRKTVMVVGLAVGAVLATAVAANATEGGHRAFRSWTSMGHSEGDRARLANAPKAPNGMASSTTQPSVMTAQLAFKTVDDAADPTFNQLLGINDGGRVAGYFGSGADAAHPNKGYVVTWAGGMMPMFHNENFPGSTQTQVVGINDHNVTVGFFVNANGENFGFADRDGHFWKVWNPNTPRTNRFNQLLGVNDNDVAVGFYNDAKGNSHGYLYWLRTGKFRSIRLPWHADSVVATGINNRGDVSGFYTFNKVTHGFILAGGHFFRLDFGSQKNTQALGINNDDQVVGSFVDAKDAMHGFIWRRGRVRQIDDPMGAGGTLVNGLNNRGQVVGFYMDKAGLTHGFLAWPGRLVMPTATTPAPTMSATTAPTPTATTPTMAPTTAAPAPAATGSPAMGTHF